MMKIMLKEPVGGGLLGDSPARSIMYIEVEGTIDEKFRTVIGNKADWFLFTMRGYPNKVIVPANNIAYIMEMN